MTELLERLHILDRQINELAGRRRVYVEERGYIIGKLMAEHGWKQVALVLGVSKSRLYQLRKKGKMKSEPGHVASRHTGESCEAKDPDQKHQALHHERCEGIRR